MERYTVLVNDLLSISKLRIQNYVKGYYRLCRSKSIEKSHNLQDLIKKIKTNKHITEDALVLDPDLIDLTMIPPPMTPDEVSV